MHVFSKMLAIYSPLNNKPLATTQRIP